MSRLNYYEIAGKVKETSWIQCVMFVVGQSLSSVQLSVAPWMQHVRPFCPPLSPEFAQIHAFELVMQSNHLKLMSIGSMIPSNHLILCCPLLLLPSIFPSIRIFSNESTLHIRWPKYWSISMSSSVNIQGWFPLRLTGLISLLSRELSRVFSSTIIWKHPFFGAQPSLWCNSHIHMWLLEKP